MELPGKKTAIAVINSMPWLFVGTQQVDKSLNFWRSDVLL